jgi:transcription elongation factor GreB
MVHRRLPAGTKNYMTPGGFARLKAELDQLLGKERPELVATIAWAAGNGDRSENGDYIYGKRACAKSTGASAFSASASTRRRSSTRRCGATTMTRTACTLARRSVIRNARGEERTVSIVGVDEIDTARGYISWVSPMARALLKAREGDTVTLMTPGGEEELDIVAVRYEPLATGDAPA